MQHVEFYVLWYDKTWTVDGIDIEPRALGDSVAVIGPVYYYGDK